MKVKKIILSLISLVFICGFSGKIHARYAPSIRERCEYLVNECGVYRKSDWQKLILEKKLHIKAVLDYFCKNRDSFKSKDYMELIDIARVALGNIMNDDLDCYDRSCIICSRSYEEFVHNLTTVYLTYADIEDSVMVLHRMKDDAKFVPHAHLLLYGVDQYPEEKDRLDLLKRKDFDRVRDEVERRMQSVGLSVVSDSLFVDVDAQLSQHLSAEEGEQPLV